MEKPDYFAELHVAGLLAGAGWNVYFPHRDEGFDFIITRQVGPKEVLVRPVQVKGKYPTEGKTDKSVYGYVGELTLLHPEMVLAIPFFDWGSNLPGHVAFIPRNLIRSHKRGCHCEPAKFISGKCQPKKWYAKFFDERGLNALADFKWSESTIAAADRDNIGLETSHALSKANEGKIREDRFTAKPGDFKIVSLGEDS
jgi:hypothetical protein